MIAVLVILSITSFIFGFFAVVFGINAVATAKDVEAREECIKMLIGNHDVLELRVKEDEEA